MVRNENFYFNTGSLDGNEMIRQCVDVSTAYETIRVKISSIVSDSGGGNARVFRLLREKLHIDGCWSDINCVRFANPIDPYRYIYYWSCGTLSLKFMRKNVCRSQPKLVRDFRIRGILFGWKQVEEIFVRDNERVKFQKG